MHTLHTMKTAFPLLISVLMLLPACRGGGGPAQRVGRSVDRGIGWFGYGVRRTGEGIQRAVR